MRNRIERCALIAALCVFFALAGCCSGGSKSTTSVMSQRLEGGTGLPEAGELLSNQSLIERLKSRAAAAGLKAGNLPGDASAAVAAVAPADTVETLKAKLKAAEDALAAADLKAKLKAAEDKIAELEKKPDAGSTSSVGQTPKKAEEDKSEETEEGTTDGGG